MKITKKEFIKNMTSNNIIFLGNTKKLYIDNELYCKISDILNNDKTLLEHRTYTEKSNFLVANNDSRLYFNQKGKYNFYKCEYENNIVLVCENIYHDNFDNMNYSNCIYYLIA